MSSDQVPSSEETAPTPAPVATDAPPPEPAPAAEPAAETPRPKVQLNPTVLASDDKAVAQSPGIPMPSPPSGPVSIPSRKGTELDPETEAEIAAALASGEIPGAVARPAPAKEEGPALPQSEDDLQPGTKLKGTVQSALGETVILDVGFRSSGCIQTKQFEGKVPAVGATVDVVVDKYDPTEGLIHCSLPRAARPAGNWDEVSIGQVVDCTATKVNKGGLEVSISNLRGFLPAGQVDFGFVSNLETFLGQKLRVKIIEVNPQKRNLVVSRRSYLEDVRAENREEIWKKLEVGQVVTGTVKTLKDYGAFIDLGGADGLLHVGEISWSRINHPSELLKEGQQVEVKILAADKEKGKISLGMKQLQSNPWGDLESRFPVGNTVQGKVTKTTDFGAFVELAPGVEGMIHISELDHKRVHRVTDVVKLGQEVEVKVLSVDRDKRRIALSLKALSAKPENAPKPKDEDLAPGGGAAYERKRKGPLKGGTAGGGGESFLFGRGK
ncbi:MAG: S1 RNA-binding domain-containing protein [Planctomycetales bacterium]